MVKLSDEYHMIKIQTRTATLQITLQGNRTEAYKLLNNIEVTGPYWIYGKDAAIAHYELVAAGYTEDKDDIKKRWIMQKAKEIREEYKERYNKIITDAIDVLSEKKKAIDKVELEELLEL